MTYWLFLALFVAGPTAMLALALRPQITRRHWAFLAIVVLVAVAYTTPWDNYLVASGVWTYDAHLVQGLVLGWVPIEEYTFFVLQSIFTGLILYAFLRRAEQPRAERAGAEPAGRLSEPRSE